MTDRLNIHEIDWSVYAILDMAWLGERDLESVAVQLLEAGIGVMQYRRKDGTSDTWIRDVKILRRVTSAYEIPLIINDRIDVAAAVKADGVHLGQGDTPLHVARHLLGKDAVLGGSVHNRAELKTVKDADYLGVGTVFPSSTKPELETRGVEVLKTVRRLTSRPLVAIGGIDASNVESVLRTGVDGVALSSYLMKGKDVERRALEFVQHVKKYKQREE